MASIYGVLFFVIILLPPVIDARGFYRSNPRTLIMYRNPQVQLGANRNNPLLLLKTKQASPASTTMIDPEAPPGWQQAESRVAAPGSSNLVFLPPGSGGGAGQVNEGFPGGVMPQQNQQQTGILEQAPVIMSQGQQIPLEMPDGQINPGYVMAFEQLLLNALAQSGLQNPSQQQQQQASKNETGQYRIMPNLSRFMQMPQFFWGRQQETPTITETPPNALPLVTKPIGESPVTIAPLSAFEQSRIASVPKPQIPMTFGMQKVALAQPVASSSTTTATTTTTSKATTASTTTSKSSNVTSAPTTSTSAPTTATSTASTTTTVEKQPQAQPSQVAYNNFYGKPSPVDQPSPVSINTQLTDITSYLPEILGPPNPNNQRQQVRCGAKTFQVAVERMVDVRCCGHRAFNTRVNICIRNELMDIATWQQLLFQNDTTSTASPGSTTTTEKPVGAPYRPEVLGGPTADGRQLILCAIKSYYVPITKFFDTMCCAEIPYNVKEATCKTGLISMKVVTTTTPLPIELDPYRPDIIGHPSANGVLPLRCRDRQVYVLVGDIPSTWCCDRVVMNDRDSLCINGKVVPIFETTTPTTTTPRVPPTTPRGVFLPDLFGPKGEDGRQPVRCFNRTYSVIASRLAEVKCCGDQLFSRQESWCSDSKVQPLPPELKLVFAAATTTTPPRQSAAKFDELALDDLSKPVIIGSPIGDRLSVQCLDKTIVVSLLTLEELSCCGNKIFNVNLAKCVGGNVVSESPAVAPQSAQEIPPSSALNSAIIDADNPFPELLNVLPGNRRTVSCNGKRFVIPEDSLADVACCGVTAYNSARASCVNGDVVKVATVIKSESPSPNPGLTMATGSNGLGFGATSMVELGRTLPDGRRLVRCLEKTYAIPETKISEVACCQQEIFAFFEASCINSTVVRLDSSPKPSNLSAVEPLPPPPKSPEMGDILPDGRQVVKCGNRRFMIPPDKVNTAGCCGQVAFNTLLATCVDGIIVENEQKPTTPTHNLVFRDDDSTLPVVINVVNGRSVLQCPDQRTFMLKDPNAPILCCGDMAFDPMKYRCIRRSLVERSPSPSLDDPLSSSSVNYVPAQPQSLRFGAIKKLEGRTSRGRAKSSSTHDTNVASHPSPFESMRMDTQPIVLTNHGMMRSNRSSQPLLLSSLAAATGLAKGVFTMKCDGTYWQTRGPPVFYTCCGSKMQDLLQSCTMMNTTVPILISYSEDNKATSLSDVEALAAEDDLTALLLSQQNSRALQNYNSRHPSNRGFSIELMPADREYSLPFNAGQFFSEPSSLSQHQHKTPTERQATNKQRCPKGRFCCGGIAHRKTKGQVCCQGNYYFSLTKQLACCGQEKYDITVQECTTGDLLRRRLH